MFVTRRWGQSLDGIFRSINVTLSAVTSDHARPAVLIPFDFWMEVSRPSVHHPRVP